MLAPTYSAFDYLQQFLRLLPRGRIWHRGWGTVLAADLLTLMPTWARLHSRANYALIETFPCSTLELLPEWEASLGLPDPCFEQPQTLQQRQAAVCVKFSMRGGASQDYFKRLAEMLGFEITIEQFKPFQVNRSRVGERLYSTDWAYVWRVTAPLVGQIIYFRASISQMGDRLVSYDNTMLECFFNHYKPAHTIVLFRYI